MDILLRLRPSKIDKKGIGVFTEQEIGKGDKIKLCEWWDGKVRKMNTLVGNDFKMAEIFGVSMKGGKICIPTSFTCMSLCWYLNHSERPNVRLVKSGNGIAVRHIKAGEELSIDYAQLDDNIDNSQYV